MSYPDLSDKCFIVSKHLKNSFTQISTLSSFFKSYKKLTESYSSSIIKHLELLQIEVQDDSSTLEIALHNIYTSLKTNLSRLQDFCKNMQIEIIEPLDLFSEHYQDTFQPLTSANEQVYKSLTKAKETMVKSRHKYYQSSTLAEKSNEEKQSKNQALRTQAQKSSEDYAKSIETVNKLIDEFDKTVPLNMKSLQQNEESRIYFIKSIFEKFIKNLTKNDSLSLDTYEEIIGLLSNVNSKIDVKVFVDTHKGNYSGVIKEEFVSYQKWRNWRKEINEIDIKEGTENYEEELDRAVRYILGNDEDSDSSFNEVESEEPDHGKISESFKINTYRMYFLDILENRRHKSFLSQNKLQMLAAYFKSLLTSLVVDDDRDPYTFYKTLSLLHNFYTGAKKTEYLSQLLSSHSIWTDSLRWVEVIEYAITQKIAHDKESLKNIAKIPKKKKGIFVALKNIANKIPSVFAKESLCDENEKTAAFMMMTQFSSYMSYLSIPLELCNSIILICSQRASLDKNRTCTLLAELEASRRAPLQSKTQAQLSLRIRQKELKKFRSLIHVGLSLEFLDPSNCVQLLYVSKTWRSCLMVSVLRKCLMEWNLPEQNLLRLRKFTWVKLLGPHMRDLDYPAFLNKVKNSGNADIEEMIALDVSRCYQNSDIVKSESLKNVLNVYAYYNSGVGYCQGMNYIAGTILYQYRNEEQALKVMIGLIEKFSMSELFENDLPKLKQFFYQLDRLICIKLPDLHEQFRQLSVTSSHFCSPWFITLFASHLQSRPDILAQLWDLFILEGWKTIFKASLVILSKIRRNMPDARFEDLMFALVSIPSNQPMVQVFDKTFIKEVQEVDVSNALLRELNAEYEHLKERAEKYAKK